MRVEIKEKGYCEVEAQYWADPDVILEKQTEAVEALRKVQIPGFRKGKAPDYAIKARCKKQINDWVAREMAAQAFDDVIFDTNIKPVGRPKFTEINLKKDKLTNQPEFSCKLDLLKKPEFTLGNYLELEVPKPDIDRDVPAMVEASIQDLRMRLGGMIPYEDSDVVGKGDQVTMSFSATIDGESFKGGSSEGELYTIGQNKFPEFDDFLLGMKPDEEREFDLVFPDDLPEIGGKTAAFKVTIHMGMKSSPHPVDEEFFTKLGVKDLDDLKGQLKKVAEASVKSRELSSIQEQVVNQLVANHDFKIPGFLTKPEANRIAQQYGAQAVDFLEPAIEEEVLKAAERNIKLSLILDSIQEEEPESFIDDNEAHKILVQNLQARGQDPNRFIQESQKNGTLYHVLGTIKNEFTLKWLAEKAKIIE